MVKIHIKKGDESQFLCEATTQISIVDLYKELIPIYNGRLKIHRICSEMEMLADHGISLPPNMQGLTDDQVTDLKLKDDWEERCVPSGGAQFKKDDIGRRNGQAPNEKMAEVLKKTVKEAKDMISKKNVSNDMLLTLGRVQEAVDLLRGATMIVYPMGLPPHEPIRMEFENNEELSGSQASLDIIDEPNASLWWAGREFQRGKKLADYVGKNEKTKIVAKLQKRGQGAPGREPVVGEEEQKQMMAYAYRKQEEFKKMEENSEDAYMDSDWADKRQMQKQFHGLNNISWQPK